MLTDANRFAQAHGDQPFAGNQYQETVTASHWTHTTDGVCQSPGDWAGEEALDVETVHGMAPGATVHYFGANSCADQDINATMATIVDNHAADIVSSSFGETMHRASGSIDPALISQATQLFQYAAAEGIGLYFATGDCGDDSNRTGPGCDPESARAQTEWPVSSPWVTGVGGTALALGAGADPAVADLDGRPALGAVRRRQELGPASPAASTSAGAAGPARTSSSPPTSRASSPTRSRARLGPGRRPPGRCGRCRTSRWTATC